MINTGYPDVESIAAALIESVEAIVVTRLFEQQPGGGPIARGAPSVTLQVVWRWPVSRVATPAWQAGGQR